MFTSAIKTNTVANTVAFRHRAGNCILVTIAIICMCILVACGVIIVREYALGKSYIATQCVVRNVTIGTHPVQCQYCSVQKKTKEKGKGTCTDSSFPCVKIIVNYSHDGIGYRGTLHHDSLQARGKFQEVCMDRGKMGGVVVTIRG